MLHAHDGMSWWWFVFGAALWLAFWAALIAFTVWAIRGTLRRTAREGLAAREIPRQIDEVRRKEAA